MASPDDTARERPSNEIFQALKEVDSLLNDLSLEHCVIGGLAVVRWGRARSTQDVDFSVFVELGEERDVCEAMLTSMSPRIDDAVRFALVNRVLLAVADNGVSVDVGLAAFPFEQDIISRSTPFAFTPDVSAPTASAEDLIVMKCIANRGQDWSDVESIIVRQSNRLDWELVTGCLKNIADLLPEADILDELAQMRQKLRPEGYE